MKMASIIRTELLKLTRWGNYILLALMVLMDIGLSVLFFYQFSGSSNVTDPSGFIDIGQQILGAQSSLAGLLIGIFIIMSVGREYKDGTLRKNIIDGFTRSDFFSGKLIIMLFCVTLAFLLGMLSLLIGSVSLGKIDDLVQILNAPFLINFFIKLLYSALFAFFLIFLFKKTTIGIVMFFVWGIIESILTGIQAAYIQFSEADPFIMLNEILPKSSIDVVLNTNGLIEPQAVIITSFYIALMLFLPYYLFFKADIRS